MGIFKSDDPVAVAERERKRAEAEERYARQRAEFEAERADIMRRRQEEEFLASPVGRARTSFDQGDHLFHISFDIESIQADVVAMSNAFTRREPKEVLTTLNQIVAEGWVLHSFSTAFVNEGEVSRDKFMSSGQQVAVRGRLVGTYVFSRGERHHT